jgi:aquaporin Z
MNDAESPRQLHWVHYAIEAWGLGTFMIVAGSVAVALAVVPPPLAHWLSTHALAGRAIFGAAMGLTAISIVYSPWGARSGAHLNPAVTLTFAFLGKLRPHDAIGYALAQFTGGVLGFSLVALLAGPLLLGPPSYAIVTKPGPLGIGAAFAGETTIAFIMMSVVLAFSNARPRVARFTGIAAGILVALFITFEAPLSGMSLNPARTFASGLIGHDFTAIWLYFIAPPLGMLLAALAFVSIRSKRAVLCGRLNHTGPYACIFNCSRNELQ